MLVCSLLSPEEKMRVAVGIAKVEEIILGVRVYQKAFSQGRLPKLHFPKWKLTKC